MGLGAWALWASQPLNALAQCSMCKATVRGAASASPSAVADTLNLAVLVLLIPPVIIFSAFFLLLARYKGGTDDREVKALKTARSL